MFRAVALFVLLRILRAAAAPELRAPASDEVNLATITLLLDYVDLWTPGGRPFAQYDFQGLGRSPRSSARL